MTSTGSASLSSPYQGYGGGYTYAHPSSFSTATSDNSGVSTSSSSIVYVGSSLLPTPPASSATSDNSGASTSSAATTPSSSVYDIPGYGLPTTTSKSSFSTSENSGVSSTISSLSAPPTNPAYTPYEYPDWFDPAAEIDDPEFDNTSEYSEGGRHKHEEKTRFGEHGRSRGGRKGRGRGRLEEDY